MSLLHSDATTPASGPEVTLEPSANNETRAASLSPTTSDQRDDADNMTPSAVDLTSTSTITATSSSSSPSTSLSAVDPLSSSLLSLQESLSRYGVSLASAQEAGLESWEDLLMLFADNDAAVLSRSLGMTLVAATRAKRELAKLSKDTASSSGNVEESQSAEKLRNLTVSDGTSTAPSVQQQWLEEKLDAVRDDIKQHVSSEMKRLLEDILKALKAVMHSFRVPGPYLFVLFPETTPSSSSPSSSSSTPSPAPSAPTSDSDSIADLWSTSYRLRFLCQWNSDRLCLNLDHTGYSVRFAKDWVFQLVPVVKTSLMLVSVALLCLGVPPILGRLAGTDIGGGMDSALGSFKDQLSSVVSKVSVKTEGDAGSASAFLGKLAAQLVTVSLQLQDALQHRVPVSGFKEPIDQVQLEQCLDRLAMELNADTYESMMALVNRSPQRQEEVAKGVPLGGLEQELMAGDEKTRWCCARCSGRDCTDANTRLEEALEQVQPKASLTAYGVSSDVEKALKAHRGHHVTRLGAFSPKLYDFLRDSHLTLAASLWANSLRSLDFSYCTKLTDLGLANLLQRCTQLQSLNVSGCATLGPKAFDAIATHCPRLQHLSVGGCPLLTDAAVAMIAQRCPQLVSWKLWGCANLTNAALLSLSFHSTQLQALDVWQCAAITEVGVSAVLLRCLDLRYLNIASCTLLSDEAFVHPCAELRAVDMRACKQVTDTGVVRLVESAPRLEKLNLRWCSQISDSAVQRCRELRPDCEIKR